MQFFGAIILVYIAIETLGRCVNGMLSLEFINDEIVFANSSSADSSRAICGGYPRHDERIRVKHRSQIIKSGVA